VFLDVWALTQRSNSVPNSSLNGNGLSICMLATNDMLNDPRVTRHAETLGTNGFKVTVICTKSDRTQSRESRNGYEIVRVRSNLSYRAEILAKRWKERRKQDISRARKGADLDIENASLPKASHARGFSERLGRHLISGVRFTLLQLSLLKAALETRARVYCANDLDTLLIAILAAGFDRKVVYDAHELWPDMLISVPEFYRQIFRSLEKLLVRHCNRVMTVNELIAEVLETRNRPRSPVCSVYNIPVQVLKQNRNRRLRKRGKAIVLYQGRYAPERGLETLVKSSEYLRRDIQLVFRGYGDIEDELRTLAKGRRNVRFDEPVAMDEMVDAAQNADVGIVSYLPTNINNYLASPNKLFEYIQAGLPIAASESPLMRKIVLANRIGVLFDPADPRTIAAALNEITRKKELDRYRRNVASVATKYTWPVESRKLLQIYTELMKEFE